MKTRLELKKETIHQLGGNIFDERWLLGLVALIITSAIMGLTSVVAISIIIAGPISYGIIRAFVRVAKGQDDKIDIKNLFSGFTDKLGESIICSLLSTLFIFFWSLLLIIPGIIKSYSYSMAMYLLHEDDTLSGSEAITLSRKLMKGHKWQAFVLDLSFIGWYLIGFLTLGIGLLWVAPYHELTKINFYKEVYANKDLIDVK